MTPPVDSQLEAEETVPCRIPLPPERETNVEASIGPGHTSANVISPAPLTWEQEQIWLHGMLFPELPLYAETFCVRYKGELKLEALECSLSELCRRYDVLRITIQEKNGLPQQVVGAAGGVKVRAYDLAGENEAGRAQKVDALLDEFARRPFNLSRGPLLRVFAVRFGAEDTRVFLTLHHLVFDGSSLRQVLLPELVELYEAFAAGSVPAAAAKTMQYVEYARRQQGDGPGARERTMDFWRSNLAEAAPLNLPMDRPRTAVTSRRGGVERFEFEAGLAEALIGLARRERSTPFAVLLATFQILLARYCDTNDVTVGTVYGGRNRTELEKVVGCFLNILLLRTDMSGDPSFRDVLARVREVTLDAVDHAEAPFQEVVREALPGGAGGNSPVQAVFAFQPPAAKLPDGWDVDVFEVFNGCAKFDLHLEVEQVVEQAGGGFRGRLMYNCDLFDAATIRGFMGHWMNLIRAAVEAPERCIWRLNLLGETEREWLLHGLNDSKRETPRVCVHDLFLERARADGGRVAVSFEGKEVSYGELERWSACVAERLQGMGFGEGAVVGLMVERSPEMIAGLLGIMRAGSAYMPLDPSYPAARLAHMRKASGMGLLLTQRHLAEGLRADDPPVLMMEDVLAETAEGTELGRVPVSASAYILFTSGSTGVPKGVEIPHEALTNLVWSMRERPGMNQDDVLLAATSISFDIAALELYLPLIVGGRIELGTVADATDPEALARQMERSGSTMMQATPATWRMLVDDGWHPARAMKLLCGGEALTSTLARQLMERSSEVWNMYGPTETTIWSACARVEDAAQIGLGEPVANTQMYMLDSHKTLLPAGISGELYIGGDGLAKGYRGQAELTAERFPWVELTSEEAVRLYATGDRVKRTRDGSLVFLGRNDGQIKLHGFRMELGEIEQALSAVEGVQQSIVLQMHQGTPGEILAGFVVPKAGATVKVEDLRDGMAKMLPAYMQPAALHILTEVPLTLNGKLDRSRLPDLLPKMVSAESGESEEPRTGIEEKLAAMWCELLSVERVGRGDNFFEIGGHSLLAARFISIAGQAFGRKFTFASFVQAATIAQFAQVVEGRKTPRIQVLKQGSDLGKQLLWIGAEPWLSRFARHLKDDVSLYTFTPEIVGAARRRTDGAKPGTTTIETMATQILGDIREVQPEGPYLLAGFCLRSLIAYEVAQRLRREGREVALLVLGDVYAPGQRPQWTRVQRVLRRIHRESHNLWSVMRTPLREWRPKLHALVGSWIQRVTDRSKAGEPETRHELLRALYKAEPQYHATPYDGRVLFMESGESRLLEGSTSASWKNLINDVEPYRYPGIHENVLNEPYLGLFAEELQQSIDRNLALELTSL